MEVRNFCIIAHIDHGKSTLADRFIEITGTVSKREMREQILDQMDLERERGITIKLQPVRMHWRGVQLNLIDTPGHTDFRYEVSRSLAAVEGAILLVDATQGVQAQTISVLRAAQVEKLTIIPAVNKIDLPVADVERAAAELCHLLPCGGDDVLRVSAKEGTGVEELLQAVIERIPPPQTGGLKSRKGTWSPRDFTSQIPDSRKIPVSSSQIPISRALIFDAKADTYRGVIAYVRVVEGSFRAGDPVTLLATKVFGGIREVGRFSPSLVEEEELAEGEIGYVMMGIKDLKDVRVGDTLASAADAVPLPGYERLQSMVFAGLYPTGRDDRNALREALEKLQMNDSALTVEPETNAALGNGFRCGFLGLLHMDIVQERLEREHGCALIVTAPTVQYEVVLRAKHAAAVVRSSLLDAGRKVATISNPADFPDPTYIEGIREPWVSLEVVAPADKVGIVMELVQGRRGVYRDHEYLDPLTALLRFDAPLQGIILDFFDRLKSLTSGYGSMSYSPIGFRAGDLVKLDILLLGEKVDALSSIVHRREAQAIGGAVCRRLKEVLPKAQYAIPIQAAIGGKVVSRETLAALRKDVTAPLYGGDVTRKRKLLERQKKGKERLKQMGKITLTQEAFLSVLRRGEGV